MRHKLFLGAIAFLFAIGLHVTTIQDAQASAAEFFKCKLAEDATMEQLVTATEAYLAAAKENGHEGYSVRFLSPVFSRDISPGTYWWVGVGPNLAAVGAVNDYWFSDANKEHRDRFSELSPSCETSSLHMVTNVGEMMEEE